MKILQNLPEIVQREIRFPKLNKNTPESKEERKGTTLRIISMLDVKFSGDSDEEKKQDRNLAMSEFTTFLRGYNLTSPEVIEAYRMAIKGDFKIDVYPNLSLIQCGKILEAYQNFKINSPIRDKAIENLKCLLNPKDVKPTPEELAQHDLIFKQNIFKEIQSKGYAADADYFFKKLEEKGKLKNWNRETKEKFYHRVENYYLKTTQIKSATIGAISKGFVQELKKDVLNGKKRDEIKIICRAIMVSNYLKKHSGSFEEFLNALEN